MASLTLESISKSYGPNTVVRDFSAAVDDGEFLVLLGPSGCGKSTMLRMIAGLTDISSGTVRFGDKVVNTLTPKQRNIAFVFQSYALYPHMSVRSNIAFPLIMDNFRWWHHIPGVGAVVRRRLLARPDIAERVASTADMLELTDYLDRRPKALSGGQRQRVAVARSVIREPALYLFDEPLSNLDAKLRMQMRAEISALHARARKTFVYVTHDQVEAMTMGTRIIVMDKGDIQQFGTPRDIYETPANRFVAEFIGAPPMNMFTASVRSGRLVVDGVPVEGSGPTATLLSLRGLDDVVVGVRAEKLVIDAATPSPGAMSIDGHVELVEHLGAESVVGFKAGPASPTPELGPAASRRLHYARLPGEQHYTPGAACRIEFSPDALHLFDPGTGRRIDREADAAR